jgi:hypothetical protein
MAAVRSNATQEKKKIQAFAPDSGFREGPKRWNPLAFLKERKPKGNTLDLQIMKDLGHKTGEILKEYNLPVPHFDTKDVKGEEVGDDRVDASRNPTQLAAIINVQESVVGMKTSKDDTFISKSVWNFCEVTSGIPSDPTGSYDFARKVGDFSNLEYTDSVILRIILDCSKGDRSHSSTAVGKMTMLGSRTNTPRAENRLTWMLASFMQDSMLRTSHASDPKYLPQIMGGSGVRALFDLPLNLHLYVRAYRGGGYDRLYGTAVQELMQCLRLLEQGQASMPVLSLRLRDRQEYLHGTYDEKVFVPTLGFKDEFKGELPMPLYRATGGQNRFVSFENRLIRTRKVLSRADAEREFERAQRIRQALFGLYPTVQEAELVHSQKRRKAREEFGRALTANSAFKNLLDRNATIKDVRSLLGSKSFLTVNTGVTQFTILDAQWIFNGGKSDVFSIEDLTSSEDIFVRTEVSEEESFKVGGLALHPIIGNKVTQVRTSVKVGLYQINQTMEEWSDDLLDKLLKERDKFNEPIDPSTLIQIFSENPEWVNDDSLLIARCLNDTAPLHLRSSTAILVSSDHRLGNQMANTCNINVFRLEPSEYLKILYFGERGIQEDVPVSFIAPFIRSLHGKAPPSWLYIDTGSLASAASAYQIDTDRSIPTLTTRKTRESGSRSGHRFVTYELRDTNRPVAVRTILHSPVQQPKRFKMYNSLKRDYSLSFKSETGSWRAYSQHSWDSQPGPSNR